MHSCIFPHIASNRLSVLSKVNFEIFTDIKEHGEKDDQPEPDVEGGDEENNRNQNVDDGRHDAEDDGAEETVDAVGASVHHSEHLTRLPGQMPPQT